MNNCSRLALCMLVALGAASVAIANEAVLAEDKVSVAALVDALDPPLTRAWVGRERPPPKASLLVTFTANSAELTSGAQRMLDVMAAAMKSERLSKLSFAVEGHADPRGAQDLNRRLSQERAQSVRDYLVTSHGLDANRLRAQGKGSSQLLNRQTPAAPENRRVTFVALKPG